MKHLKIQHLSNISNNPEEYSSCEQYPKNIDFQNSKPPKNSADPRL